MRDCATGPVQSRHQQLAHPPARVTSGKDSTPGSARSYTPYSSTHVHLPSPQPDNQPRPHLHDRSLRQAQRYRRHLPRTPSEPLAPGSSLMKSASARPRRRGGMAAAAAQRSSKRKPPQAEVEGPQEITGRAYSRRKTGTGNVRWKETKRRQGQTQGQSCSGKVARGKGSATGGGEAVGLTRWNQSCGVDREA